MAPVDQAAQRLLAGLDAATAAGEQREAVVEASDEVDERQRAQPGRRELDGQGQAVEALDELLGQGLLVGADREVGPDGGRTCREEVERLVAGQRGDRPGDLTGHGQRLPAGGQHVQPGALAEERNRQLRRLVDDVLAVVEDDEGTPAAERVHQAVELLHGGVARPVPVDHAERPRRLGHDGRAGRQRSELDQRGRPCRVVGDQPAGQLDGDGGLARSTRPDQREQARRRGQRRQRGQLPLPADEGHEALRQAGADRSSAWWSGARRRQRVKGRVVTEDPGLQVAQLRPGLQPQLLGQDPAGVAEGPQRVGLPVLPVAGQHQQRPPPLDEWLAPAQRLDLRRHVVDPAPGELRLEAGRQRGVARAT